MNKYMGKIDAFSYKKHHVLIDGEWIQVERDVDFKQFEKNKRYVFYHSPSITGKVIIRKIEDTIK